MAKKYGMKWSFTNILVASNKDEVINRHDSSTGLHLFIPDAATTGTAGGGMSDLSSIYGLVKN